MDKAVEELQQELKLLKNEIKETLTDVREVLLNTVDNPFPQDSGPSAVMATPAPAAAAPAPVVPPPPPPTDAAAPQQPNPQQPQQQQQMPQQQMQQMPQGGGGPMILGNLGGGSGGPSMPPMNMMGMMSQSPMAPGMDMDAGPGSAPESHAFEAAGAGLATDVTKPAGGPGLPPGGRSNRAGGAKNAGRPEAGPGQPPRGAGQRGARDNKAEEAEDAEDNRGRGGRKSAKARDDRADGKGPSRDRRRPEGVRDLDDDAYDDTAYDEDGYEDEDNDEQDEVDRKPRGKVDLVILASLSPWLTDGIRRLGRKRVKSLLEVYASMGSIDEGMKDVLIQIVDLDDTEGAVQPVSVQDTMRFLIELDDLMWRGRQDWRRAALVTMLGAGLHPLGD